MTNSCQIGEDLLVKILLTLRPKTLMRFKCVAKWWCALINNPNFVENHLSESNFMHNNVHQPTFVFMNRLLTEEPPIPPEAEFPSTFGWDERWTHDPETDKTESVFSVLTFCKFVVDDDDRGVHCFLSGVEDINIPLPMRLEIGGESRSLSIRGHCNGIICLVLKSTLDYSRKVFLWNPAIQEFKLLPSETYLLDWLSPLWEEHPYCPLLDRLDAAIGFGYDPICKGYKVVNVRFSGSTMHGDYMYVVVYPLKVEVYTLGTDYWREIKTYSLETETTYLWPERFQIYFKGMCYWSGIEQHKEFVEHYDTTREELEKIRQVIISFDVSLEVFHDVLFPDELVEFVGIEHYFDFRLTVWNESIALFADTNYHYFGIWLMDDNGNAKSVWTKYMVFKMNTFLVYLPLWKSDEVLLVTETGCVVCYNLRTKHHKYLPIQSSYWWFSFNVPGPEGGYSKICHAPVVYVNSIVSVLGGNTLEN